MSLYMIYFQLKRHEDHIVSFFSFTIANGDNHELTVIKL